MVKHGIILCEIVLSGFEHVHIAADVLLIGVEYDFFSIYVTDCTVCMLEANIYLMELKYIDVDYRKSNSTQH